MSTSRSAARATAAALCSHACPSTSSPPQLRELEAGTDLLVIDTRPLELGLESYQVVGGKPAQDRLASLLAEAELGQQIAVQIRIAEADHSAAEPSRVQGGFQHLDHLDGAAGRRGADQL